MLCKILDIRSVIWYNELYNKGAIMKYLLAIRVTNPETGEVETDIFEFDNEFQREDTCWEIDQMKNPCIEYAYCTEDLEII